MKSFYRGFLRITLLAALLFAPLLVQPPVSAHHCFGHEGEGGDVTGNIAECLDAGACLDEQAANCVAQDSQDDRLSTIMKLVVNIITIIVGVVAVIMIIIGGLKYITSGGDSNSVNSAKNTILYAVIGLVVVALAQVIVRFVLDKSNDSAPATGSALVRRI